MSDTRLRELERAVARGEPGAVEALRALRVRRGMLACGHALINVIAPGLCYLCRPEGSVLVGRLATHRPWRGENVLQRRSPGYWHLVYFRQLQATAAPELVASCRRVQPLDEFKWGMPACRLCSYVRRGTGELINPEHVARLQAHYAGIRHELSTEDRARSQVALFA